MAVESCSSSGAMRGCYVLTVESVLILCGLNMLQKQQKLDACSTSMIHLMRSVRRERRSATDFELAVG